LLDVKKVVKEPLKIWDCMWCYLCSNPIFYLKCCSFLPVILLLGPGEDELCALRNRQVNNSYISNIYNDKSISLLCILSRIGDLLWGNTHKMQTLKWCKINCFSKTHIFVQNAHKTFLQVLCWIRIETVYE
jgi:hypothetical protein